MLTAAGFVVARVALRQADDRLALAQGLVIGPAAWGLIVNFVLHLLPGRVGALAGWALLLAFVALLAWRARPELRVDPRTLAGFGVVGLAVFGMALAARQVLTIGDPHLHVGLAPPIQAGVWPPVLPWSPWQPAPYHYGVILLVALLAPPVGPDLAFTVEILHAFAWTALTLLVAALLLRRGGRVGLLTLGPLILTAGAWTPLLAVPPALLKLPIPTGLPDDGLTNALAGVYWPALEWPWRWPDPYASPPNIWLARFTVAHGLAFTVLERAANRRSRGWPIGLALAALVGFLGLVEEAVALTVLGLWVLLEAARFERDRPWRAQALGLARRAIAGPIAAAVLLAVGGGVITSILAGSAAGDLSIGWIVDEARLRPLWSSDVRPGGLALLGLGPAVLAVAALLLARRDRLVLALAAGSAVFLLATIVLQTGLSWSSDTRLDGHAGNFALLALLLVLASRLAALRPRWRMASSAALGLLVVWPTVVLPVRTLGVQVGHGITLANAPPGQTRLNPAQYARGIGRRPIEYLTPGQVVDYLPHPPPPLHYRPTGALAPDRVVRHMRDHTPPDARIFSPHPIELTLGTGRANAAGLAGYLHIGWKPGPEYQDVLQYLEPAAVRRLGFGYIHATDAWVAQLPDRAQDWLQNPRLFELLVRDGAHALYRVLPAFTELPSTPEPASYAALRQAVPAAASVYLAPNIPPEDGVRLAATLDHARLLGRLDPGIIHLLTPIPTEPVGARTPDFIALPARLAPSVLPPTLRRPVWWNHEIAVYALSGAIPPLADAPPAHFSIDLSDVQFTPDRLRFTATVTDRAPDRCTARIGSSSPPTIRPGACPFASTPLHSTRPSSVGSTAKSNPFPTPTSTSTSFSTSSTRAPARWPCGTEAHMPTPRRRIHSSGPVTGCWPPGPTSTAKKSA